MSSSDIARRIVLRRRWKSSLCIIVWVVGTFLVCVAVFFSTDSSLLVGCTALLLIGWTGIYWHQSHSDHRVPYSTRHWRTATVAYDLIPYLDALLHGDRCKLVITGNDAYALTLPDYPWGRFLRACLEEKRCSVIWYVSCLNEDADRELRKLHDDHNGAFEYRRLADPDIIVDPADKQLLTVLQDLHPTLAWNPDTGAKMMWVEGYHPPRSTYASNCDYYGPDLLEKNAEEFEFYRQQLDRAWQITKDFSFENP